MAFSIRSQPILTLTVVAVLLALAAVVVGLALLTHGGALPWLGAHAGQQFASGCSGVSLPC